MGAPAVEVPGVVTLSVQSVRCDHRAADVYAVQQGGEQRDLVGLGAHFYLAQHRAMGMVERSEQVRAVLAARVAPRKVLPSTAINRRLPGRAWSAARPTARPAYRSITSSRCSTRRIVDSDGTRPATPSRAKVSSPASAAHSAIAAYDRAPASTAHTASTMITTSRCRTPAACAGQPPAPAPPAGQDLPSGLSSKSTRWPITGSACDDDAAGMVPREAIRQVQEPPDHFEGRARAAARASPACRTSPVATGNGLLAPPILEGYGRTCLGACGRRALGSVK